MKNSIFLLFILIAFSNCKNKDTKEVETISDKASTKLEKQLIEVFKAKDRISIDGVADDAAWQNNKWYPIDQVWLGDSLSDTDFSGRYKLSWSDEALYILAEIKDDTLIDKTKNPLVNWWDDDCLEIFVDEDNSGGEHQFNHNAFAYHIALDGNIVDMATTQEGKLFNSHIQSEVSTTNTVSIWEVKMLLFDDSYNDDNNAINTPIKLKANKKVGFALAYCDNDYSETREHFIGSVAVEGDDKNRGWIDANIFGTLLLLD